MADIPVEKRGGSKWWMWLLGLLILGGLIWLVAEIVDTDEPEVAAIEEVEPITPTEPEAAVAGVTIGDILSNPDQYVGQTFPDTEVEVSEVPTDRGFWIQQNGQRLFAVIIDQPMEQPKDINPGQTLLVEDGTLRDSEYLGEIPGVPLDQNTQTIAQEQSIFLVVDERYINIVEAGTPQAGTDPAQTAPAQSAQ